MSWKNLKLSYKISIGLSLMILIGVLGLLNDYRDVHTIENETARTLKAVGFADTLYAAEIAHLTWVNIVAVQINRDENKPLTVHTDGRECVFGKWYYGPERIYLENRVPSLRSVFSDLETPHLNLHHSALAINTNLQNSNFAEAKKIFHFTTMPLLETIKTNLNTAREIVNTRITEINENLMKTIHWTQNSSIVTIISLLIVGFICSWFITRSITKPIKRLVSYAESVANGNLVQPSMHRTDEVGKLAKSMGSMVTTLIEKIEFANQKTETALQKEQEALQAQANITKSSKETAAKHAMLLDASIKLSEVINVVSSAAEQLSAQIYQCEQGAVQAAHRLDETSRSMDELNSTVVEIAKNSSNTAQLTHKARAEAETGATIVQNSLSSITAIQNGSAMLKDDMQDLGMQAKNITQIMSVISDIADQTNLLALNAAIEAARAGDAGRGFAVVADEVRKLAEKTMISTTEVSKAIHAIQASAEKSMMQVDLTVKQIETTTTQSNTSKKALHSIVSMVDTVADCVHSIATAADQQASTSGEISQSLSMINNVAHASSITLKEASQAISEIAKQTHVLSRLVSSMKDG